MIVKTIIIDIDRTKKRQRIESIINRYESKQKGN